MNLLTSPRLCLTVNFLRYTPAHTGCGNTTMFGMNNSSPSLETHMITCFANSSISTCNK